MKFNSAYVEVRNLASGESFSIGPMRQDEEGPYKRFTVYGDNPWKGELRYVKCDGVPGWYYLGECWPL